MAVYEYRAIARSGKQVKGIIDADSAAAARRKLRDQSLHPTGLEETTEGTAAVSSGFSTGRISQHDVAMMTRQLAVLLEAGMPLVQALTALLDQTSNARLSKTLYSVRDKVNEGVTLAEALSEDRRVFSELYTNMVGAGESSGTLEQVLGRLADTLERQVRLKKRIQSSMVYPLFMALIGFGVITFLMTAIVPKISAMFASRGRDLPGVTVALMTVSDFLQHRWWVLLLIGGAIGTGWYLWVSRPEGRRQWDRFKLAVPVFGPLYHKMLCGRWSRTLGTMLESGLTMMRALDVVKTVIQNRVIEDTMDDVKSAVRRGADLSQPLKDSGRFPPMVIHMVSLGERSGQLESMLIKVANTYDEDVELTVEALVSLIEPVMILVMALFVGFLVFAILLPIFEMSSGMG